MKMSSRNKGKLKNFSDIQKIKQLFNTKIKLYKILTDILEKEKNGSR